MRRERQGIVKMELAPFKKSRSQNVPGNLFVDESCIDCMNISYHVISVIVGTYIYRRCM